MTPRVGYKLQAAPDHYVNEEWFGITAPTQCAGSVDALRPRDVYWKMRELWINKGNDSETIALFGSCETEYIEKCVALGNGGNGFFYSIARTPDPLSDSSGALACSGHGTCISDWRVCGSGNANVSATPCCSCDFGFAGAGCEQLDARLCARFHSIVFSSILWHLDALYALFTGMWLWAWR